MASNLPDITVMSSPTPSLFCTIFAMSRPFLFKLLNGRNSGSRGYGLGAEVEGREVLVQVSNYLDSSG